MFEDATALLEAAGLAELAELAEQRRRRDGAAEGVVAALLLRAVPSPPGQRTVRLEVGEGQAVRNGGRTELRLELTGQVLSEGTLLGSFRLYGAWVAGEVEVVRWWSGGPRDTPTLLDDWLTRAGEAVAATLGREEVRPLLEQCLERQVAELAEQVISDALEELDVAADLLVALRGVTWQHDRGEAVGRGQVLEALAEEFDGTAAELLSTEQLLGAGGGGAQAEADAAEGGQEG